MTRHLTLGNTTLSLSDWARTADLPVGTLARRLDRGMSLGEALAAPVATRTQAGRRGARRSPWRHGITGLRPRGGR